MAATTIAVHIPESLFHKLKRAADLTHRSVEDISPTEEYRLTQLNAAAGERGLTPAEDAKQQSLITAYQRSVLRRAKALAILAQRGHRVPITGEAGSACL